MLSVGWLVFAVLIAILLTMWVTFTVTRLDRLHARVDAAQAALDAQLVRRAAALLSVSESPDSQLDPQQRCRLEAVAHAALDPALPERRSGAENAVGRAVTELVDGPTGLRAEVRAELRETAARVLIARRFYNDAVRDTRTLRMRRMPRTLRLAGRRGLPQFFDIDDTVPSPAEPEAATEPDQPDQPDQPATPVARAQEEDVS